METNNRKYVEACPPTLQVIKTVCSNNEVSEDVREEYWFGLMNHCFDSIEEKPKCQKCFDLVNQFLRENFPNN